MNSAQHVSARHGKPVSGQSVLFVSRVLTVPVSMCFERPYIFHECLCLMTRHLELFSFMSQAQACI